MATRINPRGPQHSSWPAAPGVYLLLLRSAKSVSLSVGRLGAWVLPAGHYAYVGSALGPGGLAGRLGRHLRTAKPIHWHIDALTARLPIVAVQTIVAAERLECAWVQRLLAQGADAPIPGFGSSDCRAGCPAHLLRLPETRTVAEGILRDIFEGEYEVALWRETKHTQAI